MCVHDNPSDRQGPSDIPPVDAVRRAVAIAFLATLYTTRKLWLSTRDYPLTPVWHGAAQPPHPLDFALLAVMSAALLAVGFSRNPRVGLVTACVIGAFWAALDQSRWQPYFVHFMVMLCCLLAIRFDNRDQWDAPQIDRTLLPARLMVAFTYIYSGLHKLNLQFTAGVFPWMLGPLEHATHLQLGWLCEPFRTGLALGVAIGEAGCGLLILFPKPRRFAAAFLAFMHCFLLFTLGPLGYAYNKAVWPWNIEMIVILWALFWHGTGADWPTPRLISRTWWAAVGPRHLAMVAAVVLGFGIMPTLSFFGRWDSGLSFSLYSGSSRDSDIRVDPEDIVRMPPAARAVTHPITGAMDLTAWSTQELGALPYSEDRIGLSIGRSLGRRARHGPIWLRLSSEPAIVSGKRTYRYYEFPPGGGTPRETTREEFDTGRSAAGKHAPIGAGK